MKKIAILQSNYIPWKGYFDIIGSVDEFVIYDVAQYTKNDWRNRNKLKTPSGVEWLTIPVRQNSLEQKINETTIAMKNWNVKHWKTIVQNYSKAPFFKEYKDFFEELYINCNEEFLSKINFHFISAICKLLQINTKILWADDFRLIDGQTERLLGICRDCCANVYLSGPAAKNYLDEKLFSDEGIKVEWMDYSNYPQYSQLFPPFEHGVSILDLIFNVGPDFKNYMKSGKI